MQSNISLNNKGLHCRHSMNGIYLSVPPYKTTVFFRANVTPLKSSLRVVVSYISASQTTDRIPRL